MCFLKERLVITELQGGDQLMGKKELKKDLAETQTKNEEGELVDHPSFFRGKERNFAPLIETERQMDSDTYNFVSPCIIPAEQRSRNSIECQTKFLEN